MSFISVPHSKGDTLCSYLKSKCQIYILNKAKIWQSKQMQTESQRAKKVRSNATCFFLLCNQLCFLSQNILLSCPYFSIFLQIASVARMTLQSFGNSGVTFYLLCNFWYFFSRRFPSQLARVPGRSTWS